MMSSSRVSWACKELASRKKAAPSTARRRIIERSFVGYRSQPIYTERVCAKETLLLLKIERLRFSMSSIVWRSFIRAPPNDFTSEPLEPQDCFPFALSNQADRRSGRHRSCYDRQGMLPDGLVDIIVVIVFASHGPFETDRRHRAGTYLRIAGSLRRRRGRSLFLSSGDFWRVIGRINLAQKRNLQNRSCLSKTYPGGERNIAAAAWYMGGSSQAGG